MDDDQLIRRAIDGEVIGDGSRQIAVLVKSLRKWHTIARLRDHAIHVIHEQIGRVWMCEHDGDERRAELLEHAAHEREVAFRHSFYASQLAEAADKCRVAREPIPTPGACRGGAE